ncbi:MAG: hypothetical protein LBM93_03420 [Oscillospiraceae bacterium]|jgi:hypothetical protein|nr:hypothetical protein [Oscillospiraceae bacterium]
MNNKKKLAVPSVGRFATNDVISKKREKKNEQLEVDKHGFKTKLEHDIWDKICRKFSDFKLDSKEISEYLDLFYHNLDNLQLDGKFLRIPRGRLDGSLKMLYGFDLGKVINKEKYHEMTELQRLSYLEQILDLSEEVSNAFHNFQQAGIRLLLKAKEINNE